MNWDGNDLHIVLDSQDRCEFCKKLDKEIIFDSKIIMYLSRETKMVDILVLAGLFKSKNDARNNWKYGLELEEGFSFDKFTDLGKLNKNLYILNVPKEYKHGKCEEEPKANG